MEYDEIIYHGLGVSCLHEDLLQYVPDGDTPDPMDDQLRLKTARLYLEARRIAHTEIEARKVAVAARKWSHGKSTRRKA